MFSCRHQYARIFSDKTSRRIGLLGGSFNPAHSGHTHIADMAIQQLNLDQVIWLVSPQNPLKSQNDMADFSSRFTTAIKKAHTAKYARYMKVSAIENQLQQNQTAKVLKTLRQYMPQAKLVWIMGADGMKNLHCWHRWQAIPRTMAIAVVDRIPYTAAAINSRGAKSALRLSPRRLSARGFPPKTWCLLRGRINTSSATEIRNQHKIL